MLARLIYIVITNWLNNVTTFTKRFLKDRDELAKRFYKGKKLGKITTIQADVSDPHNGGQRVYIVTFTSGVTIVYKPRSLNIDVSWRKWLAYMASQGMPVTMYAPEVIDRGSYGWMEYITRKPLKKLADAKDYYFRAGVLLGVVYAFGTNDIHFENVIASGAYPILVDTETLFVHKVKPFMMVDERKSATQKVEDIFHATVIRTGMLPFWRFGANEQAVDWGALTYQDEVRENLPIYKGQPVDVHPFAEYLTAWIKWFFSFVEKERKQLLAEDSPLFQLFAACQFRVLVRASQTYFSLLQHVTQPQFLQDGLLYSLEIERMAPAYLLYVPEEPLKAVWKMLSLNGMH